MTIAVDLGRKATKQTKNKTNMAFGLKGVFSPAFKSIFALKRAWANAQTCQSLCCSHPQCMDVDEDSDQNLEL